MVSLDAGDSVDAIALLVPTRTRRRTHIERLPELSYHSNPYCICDTGSASYGRARREREQMGTTKNLAAYSSDSTIQVVGTLHDSHVHGVAYTATLHDPSSFAIAFSGCAFNRVPIATTGFCYTSLLTRTIHEPTLQPRRSGRFSSTPQLDYAGKTMVQHGLHLSARQL